MKKARILLISGILMAILPYLGFPYSWKDILFSLFGLGIIGFSYILYKDYKTEERSEKKVFDNFSENNNFNKNENEIKTTEGESQESMGINQE